MSAGIESFLYRGQNFLVANWQYFVFFGLVYIIIYEFFHVWWHFYFHAKVHKYMHSQKQVLLQLRFPRENLKTPKAMEQVIASLHGTHSFIFPWRDTYLKGKVEDWFSLEIVGKSTGISFYTQVQEGNRKLFETAFFAQYPEVEIVQVDDYLHDLPEEIPNETYNLYGTEYVLSRKDKDGSTLDAYPIKTYQSFESPVDEQRLDPMATIAEVVSNLKEDETVLIQLIIRSASPATHPHIEASAKKIINKIYQREEKKEHKIGVMSALFAVFRELIAAFFRPPNFETAKEEEKQNFKFVVTTPIDQEIAKAVENKMSKNLFETIFRFIYIDRNDSFTGENVNAIFGAVTQFSDRNMNSFQPGDGSFTIVQKLKYFKQAYHMFAKKKRLVHRKRRIFEAYKERIFPPGPPLIIGDYFTEFSILSSEELATIFHPPGLPIGAQRLAPIEMKKGGPPSSLPIIE